MNNSQFSAMASPLDLLVFFVLALLVLGGAAWVLIRAGRINESASEIDETAIYKTQLAELKQSHIDGIIDDAEYEASRLEIGLRMARAAKLGQNSKPNSQSLKSRYSIVAALALGLFSVFGYLAIGNPLHRDMPYKAREKQLLSISPEQLSQDEIMVLLQNRATKEPKDPIPHLLMGSILRGEGRNEEALRAFQAVLRRDDKNADAIALLAATMFDLNDKKADAQIERALDAAQEIDPQNMNVHFLRGQINWASGEKAKAMAIWQSAYLQYENKDPRKYGIITRIIEEISKLEIGPSANGSDAPFANMGSDPSAMINTMIGRRIEKLAQSPYDIGLRLSLARVQIMSKNPEGAEQTLKSGLKYAKTDFEAQILNQTLNMMDAGE